VNHVVLQTSVEFGVREVLTSEA